MAMAPPPRWPVATSRPAPGARACRPALVFGSLALAFLGSWSPWRAAPAYAAPSGSATRGVQSRREVLLEAALAAGGGAAASGAPAWAQQPAVTPSGDVFTLSDGLKFPTASFGLQIYDDNTAQKLTELSLQLGYRNFFASVLARNQRGFARGVQASGVPRDQLFICGTVLSNRARGFEAAYKATKQGCDENLEAFKVGGIDYVDMIMLDYPGPDCDSIKGQWKAFEEMLAAKQTRSLAVSNFNSAQLDCLLADKTATVPTVNQLPYSISYSDKTAVEENGKRGIVVQAWAPLGGSTGGIKGQARKACEEIGKKYGKTWAQVALRWIVDTGATFSMQTRSTTHFAENLNVFDFKLSQEDLALLQKVRT